MLTIFFVFAFIALIVLLAIAAQSWLFQESDEVVDREWALYEQSPD